MKTACTLLSKLKEWSGPRRHEETCCAGRLVRRWVQMFGGIYRGNPKRRQEIEATKGMHTPIAEANAVGMGFGDARVS